MSRFNAKKINREIDKAIVAAHIEPPRPYLGLSQIGEPCPRKVWFNWRWFGQEQFNARILRLFDRGHREEERFVAWLNAAGYFTEPVDPETGEQWEVIGEEGHIKGHLDGVVLRKAVLECKTHNKKSFMQLIRTQSVKVAKYQHYCQTQRYMHAMGLKWGIYIAICKDDDALYIEVLKPDREAVADMIEREHDLIWRERPPKKISQDPEYYICRFCQFHDICHYNDKPDKNCRTCSHSKVWSKGRWICRKRKKEIRLKRQRKGCANWQNILAA